MRTVTIPIVVEGQRRTRYRAPVTLEYVDVETGEIIPATEARKRGAWPEMYASERALQRHALLASLRKEVREFAAFVLGFRNNRRGITPGIRMLSEWYATYTGKQVQHVRRYISQLEAAGILAGDALLGPLFQISGRNATARSHLAEDAIAQERFAALLFRISPVTDSTSPIPPTWLQQMQAESAALADAVIGRLQMLQDRRSSSLEAIPA